MKVLSLFFASLGLTMLCSVGWAESLPTLRCQLSELRTGRVLQSREALLPLPGLAAKPILLVFSDANLMGTVRDTQVGQGPERKIELQLRFQSGSESGLSTSERRYTPEQLPIENVGEVSIETGVTSFRGVVVLGCSVL